MFDSKHYIPILKWRAAEQQALRDLSDKRKLKMTPLVQLVMPQPKKTKKGEREKTRDEQLEEVVKAFEVKAQKIADEIDEAWGKSPIFVDLGLVYTIPLITESFIDILKRGEEIGLTLIPVINLSSNKEVKKVVVALAKKYNHGMCLRLVSADLKSYDFHKNLQSFLEEFSLSEISVDL